MRALVVTVVMLLLCRSGLCGTIRERLLNDRMFKLYAVIFKITQAPNGSVIDVQLAGPHDVRWGHEHPGQSKRAQVAIPKTYVAAAIKKIRGTHYSLLKHNGRPEDSYVGFYYAPALGDRLILDVKEHE